MSSSYGGYSRNMQMLHYPELSAVGISQVGITDLNTLYAESTSQFKTAVERFVGDPEENRELYGLFERGLDVQPPAKTRDEDRTVDTGTRQGDETPAQLVGGGHHLCWVRPVGRESSINTVT
jgi:hypothetical protein